MSDAHVLSLSMISHTNVGKTTLARTLLRRDVGDVLDQAHVTRDSERFVMLESEGDDDGRIVLWDTPGFGDSARLYATLKDHEAPLAWLEAQAFDPETQVSLHSSRNAVLNVATEADVVLYLVNASEDPSMAGYVEPEMRILGWIDKPVIVLLNQSGSPTDAETRRRDEERWRWHLASFASVKDVISLDAFSRCWVQEGLLLLRLEALVPDAHRAQMSRQLAGWCDQNLSVLAESARELASSLWKAASDREAVGDALLSQMGRRRAAEELTSRLDRHTRATLDRLIALHGLEGGAASWARGALADVKVPGDKPDPRRASLLGGIAGGAVGGLVADVAVAGLSLGGGAIAGALLGAFGLGGLAWAYEQVGGAAEPFVVWSPAFLERLVRDGLLRYLAVAHYGRGAGPYRERPTPEAWAPRVEKLLEREGRAFARLLKPAQTEGSAPATEALDAKLEDVLKQLLEDLYPGAERLLRPR